MVYKQNVVSYSFRYAMFNHNYHVDMKIRLLWQMKTNEFVISRELEYPLHLIVFVHRVRG